MIYSYYEANRLPIAVIDKFYDNSAEEKIMQELLFLKNDERKLKNPGDSGSAYNLDQTMPDGKKYLKKNKAHSLDATYLDRSMSNILTENRKLFSDEITTELINYHPIFRYVKHVNTDATLVSYYEDSDYYLPHRDDATITAITWFYKNPKLFNGGNLFLEETLEIECLHNRCVIFPSIASHAVNEIHINKENAGQNFGRFAISQFLSYQI